MTCKCGHSEVDHPYGRAASHWRNLPHFPCTKCNCDDYELAPKEAGF